MRVQVIKNFNFSLKTVEFKEKRAEEALKKHVQDKNDAKIKESLDKKLKADLITGGGFDLEKAKKMNSSQTQMKNNQNSSLPTKNQPVKAQNKPVPPSKGKK